MAKKQIVNMVVHHKKIAENFLQQHIENGGVPANFSGFMTPRFGKYIFIWQFEKNLLVGACVLNIANVQNFTKKVKDSEFSYDFFEGEQNASGQPPADTGPV